MDSVFAVFKDVAHQVFFKGVQLRKQLDLANLSKPTCAAVQSDLELFDNIDNHKARAAAFAKKHRETIKAQLDAFENGCPLDKVCSAVKSICFNLRPNYLSKIHCNACADSSSNHPIQCPLMAKDLWDVA